jgi:hypothetical protein
MGKVHLKIRKSCMRYQCMPSSADLGGVRTVVAGPGSVVM